MEEQTVSIALGIVMLLRKIGFENYPIQIMQVCTLLEGFRGKAPFRKTKGNSVYRRKNLMKIKKLKIPSITSKYLAPSRKGDNFKEPKVGYRPLS